MEDVNKLDNIQDCFIHYQLLRFCQATRLQYRNGQVQLANQQVLQQHHVNHKIANALMKKGTRESYKKWNLQDHAWVDMRLHESHNDGGFVVPNNTISRHASAYTTNVLFFVFLGTFDHPVQEVCLPGNHPPLGSSFPFAHPHSHQVRTAALRQTPGRHLHSRPRAPRMMMLSFVCSCRNKK